MKVINIVERQRTKIALRLSYEIANKIVFEFDVTESNKVIYITVYKKINIFLNHVIQRELNKMFVKYTFTKSEKYTIYYLNII